MNRPPEFCTEDFTAEREWTDEDFPILRVSAVLPRPVPESLSRPARRIRRYYQTQARAYLRYCETWLLPQARAACRRALASGTPPPCFQAELRYHTTFRKKGLWSLYTQSREDLGPDGLLLTRRGDTWDLESGFPIPLSALFPPRCPWRRKLTAAVQQSAARQEAAGALLLRPHWRRALRRSFNPRNFYLTEDALALFYPMYALGPGELPVFRIPYSPQGPILPGSTEKNSSTS